MAWKSVPVMVTLVPTGPLPGVKEVTAGAGITVNVALVALPAGLVTVIAPVVAPEGTVQVILVLLTTVNEALVVLNCTCVAQVNPVPVIVTEVPIVPLVVEIAVTVGAGITVKLDELVPVP